MKITSPVASRPSSSTASRAPGTDFPLSYRGPPWARCGSPAPGDPPRAADRRLLADLARQAGLAAHAVRLTADLERARARLVLAREEERRRLRRDLHDGLGPLLGGLTLKLGAVRRAAPGSARGGRPAHRPHRADAGRGRGHPPAGRRPAAAGARRVGPGRRAAAGRDALRRPRPGRSGARGSPSRRRRPLPPLPAAVEVAAYRIAPEALTNVVRHAQAQQCQISLVFDPGGGGSLSGDPRRRARPAAGTPRRRRPPSMRERAVELGGACAIGPGRRADAGPRPPALPAAGRRARRPRAADSRKVSDGADPVPAHRRRPPVLPRRAARCCSRRPPRTRWSARRRPGTRPSRWRRRSQPGRDPDGPADARPERHRGDPAASSRTSPHVGVLVLTMYEDDDSVFAAMRAGARGYLLKGADAGGDPAGHPRGRPR